MFVPSRKQLQGLSREIAECLGKPHAGAHYLHKTGVNAYRLDDYAVCQICGRRANNVHHHPPKGKTYGIRHHGKLLRPSLWALCGTGTTGCHGLIHAGKIKIAWKWLNDESARRWWDGSLFLELGPHSERLFEHGYWDIKREGEESGLRLQDPHIFL